MNHDICVIGLGYIGLPTASIFATKGRRVLGVDVVARVVDTINAGKVHIVEPELDVLVRAATQSGNLRASRRPEPAATYIIAVPTPCADAKKGPGKSADLSYVEQATRSLATVVPAGALIILESTSPVGTTEKMRDWLLAELRQVRPADGATVGQSLLFAHCPERILPGQMLKELVANDRIAGGLTPAAAVAAKRLYQIFCTGEIFLTTARTAELAKLAENTYRDVNIAFANELSVICEKLGIDVWELITLTNRHPRVKILQPGPGVGGHCIAVDPWFIYEAAPQEAKLIRAAREVNDAKPEHVLAKIKATLKGIKAPVVACLGLAFKANVDDLRESPAVEIVHRLARASKVKILAVEPNVQALPKALAGCRNVRLAATNPALQAAHVVVLLVDHKVFRTIEPRQLAGKTVIDTRGFWR